MATQRFKTVQIGNQSLRLPLQGHEPSWAEELSEIIEALAEASQLIQGPNDVLLTSANILNDKDTPVNFGNISFNTSSVFSIECDFFVTRIFDSGNDIQSQSGKLLANFDGTIWRVVQENVGEAGIIFSITPSGVLQYSSSNLDDYVSGTCRFKAKTIDEET